MTALINEELIRSNTLTNDLICIVEGDNTPIVASSFAQTVARQYDRLTIPFVVYTPDSSLSEVMLSANNATVSTQSVDRTLARVELPYSPVGRSLPKDIQRVGLPDLYAHRIPRRGYRGAGEGEPATLADLSEPEQQRQ